MFLCNWDDSSDNVSWKGICNIRTTNLLIRSSLTLFPKSRFVLIGLSNSIAEVLKSLLNDFKSFATARLRFCLARLRSTICSIEMSESSSAKSFASKQVMDRLRKPEKPVGFKCFEKTVSTHQTLLHGLRGQQTDWWLVCDDMIRYAHFNASSTAPVTLSFTYHNDFKNTATAVRRSAHQSALWNRAAHAILRLASSQTGWSWLINSGWWVWHSMGLIVL